MPGSGSFLRGRMSIITVAVIALVIIGGFAWISSGYFHSSSPVPSSTPFSTLIANQTDKSPILYFKDGYVSPNLWNLKSGQGNVTMNSLPNGSMHTIANLSNVKTDVYTIIGYPSEHFTFTTGMSLQSVEESNLSSYVSFDVVNHTKEMPTDVAYDIFIGSSPSSLQYEIMIWLSWNNLYTFYKPIGYVNVPVVIDGHTQNINWSIIQKYGNSDTVLYEFFPSIIPHNSMSYQLGLAPFLAYLQHGLLISSAGLIEKIGIGSEFGTYSPPVTQYYSFWMYTYWVLSGKKYQIINPAEVT